MFNLTSVLLAAAVSAGSATEADSPVYPQLAPLECFVGNWEARATLPKDAPPSKELGDIAGKEVVLSVSVKWAPGKCAQIVNITYEMRGVVKILGTSIRAWAQESEVICERLFTTHKGSWTGTWKLDGKKWIHRLKGKNLDGKKCTGKRVFTFKDKDHYTLLETHTVDGIRQSTITWEFERK